MIIVTAASASILGFLYVKLSLDVIKQRQKHGIRIGDGGNDELLRAIRAQTNLAEYAPIALILLACLELNHSVWWINSILATMFVIGRLLHPMGIKSAESPWQPRVWGIQLTLISLIAMGMANLVVIGLMFAP